MAQEYVLSQWAEAAGNAVKTFLTLKVLVTTIDALRNF